jgi:acyl-coenzyme A thioesterase PaaI-like protein
MTDLRAEAAAALRALGEDFLDHVTTAEAEAEILATVDRLRAQIAQSPKLVRDNAAFAERIVTPTEDGDALSHYDECCIDGTHNPFALRISFVRDGERVRAKARFTRPYEGPTGRVHGGAIAACYEDVLGYQLTLRRRVGYMVTLSIEFLHATPLDREVDFSSEVLTTDGDRLHVVGECRAGDVVTTRAHGVLAMVPTERFRPFKPAD